MSGQHAPHDASEWVDDRDLGTDTPDAPERNAPADDDFLDDWNADPDPDAWTDHATRDDAAARSEHDPYGLVPESFVDDWGASSIPDALATAEAAPSTTDPAAQQRCLDCLAARLTPLPDARGAEWACTECHERHDRVLPSQAEAARQAAHAPDTERESALPRCRGCLSTALYPIPESAPAADRWACLDCGAGFDDALPSELATRRGEATSAEKQRIGEVMRE